MLLKMDFEPLVAGEMETQRNTLQSLADSHFEKKLGT